MWKKDKPDSLARINQIPKFTSENLSAIEEISGVEHYPVGHSDSGKHKRGFVGGVAIASSEEISENYTTAPSGSMILDRTIGSMIYKDEEEFKRLGQENWSRVRILLSSPVNITANNDFTTIPFDSADYDTLSEFSSTTHEFQAKVDGWYLITGSIGLSANLDTKDTAYQTPTGTALPQDFETYGTTSSVAAINEFPDPDDSDYITVTVSSHTPNKTSLFTFTPTAYSVVPSGSLITINSYFRVQVSGCDCHNVCYGYSECSCYTSQYSSSCGGGYVGCQQCNLICYTVQYCSCDNTAYGQSCECYNSCYGEPQPCSCDNQCYQEGCQCNNTCYGYGCTCYNQCYQEPTCTCYNSCDQENCTCYNECYGDSCPCYTACNSYSCTCHNTTYGASGCSVCHNAQYGYVPCTCNMTEYQYSCTCHVSYYQYTSCSCNASCYGYYCSCYYLCYEQPVCTCESTYHSCFCDYSTYFLRCTCYTTCYGYQPCSCYSYWEKSCNCDSTCYGFSCSCYSSPYDFSCACNQQCYYETNCSPYIVPCTCNQAQYGYQSCSCNSTCYGFSCTCYTTVYGYSCTCYYSCYQQPSCTCNMTCYTGYSTCSCYNTTYEFYCSCNSASYRTGCSCENTCYSESCRCNNTCYPDTCTCNNTSYEYQSCQSCNNQPYNLSCTCNYQQYGLISNCTCNNTTYNFIQCTCNNQCYGFSCNCYNQCYVDYICDCDGESYGYSPCSCNNECYSEVSVGLRAILGTPSATAISDIYTCFASSTGHMNPPTWEYISIPTEYWNNQEITTEMASAINQTGVNLLTTSLTSGGSAEVNISQHYLEYIWFAEKPVITIRIKKNDNVAYLINELQEEPDYTSNQVITIPPIILQLSKNDKIKFEIKKTVKNDTILSDSSYTFMNIHLINGLGI